MISPIKDIPINETRSSIKETKEKSQNNIPKQKKFSDSKNLNPKVSVNKYTKLKVKTENGNERESNFTKKKSKKKR